jgi:hypothetical protein
MRWPPTIRSLFVPVLGADIWPNEALGDETSVGANQAQKITTLHRSPPNGNGSNSTMASIFVDC